MIKKVLQRELSNKGYGFLGALLLLVIWWTVCRLGIWSTYLLPSPEMILHTFLENIFKHVISIDSFTTVLIQALWSFSGKEVYLKLELYISQGQFSQEMLDFVNKDMEITEKKDGSGIGIKNVKEVLKMMYQQDHLLYVENLEPEGTKITIWIPKTLKCTDEEKDEER